MLKYLLMNSLMFLGHSNGSLLQGEKGFAHGASFITHLFNAMLPVSFCIYYQTIISFERKTHKNKIKSLMFFLFLFPYME